MTDRDRIARFERVALPHLDAVYNLARWLMRDEHEAEDMVQEACLRALQYLDGFAGENGRAWLLTIVRNACFDRLKRERRLGTVPFDEETMAAGGEGEASWLRRAEPGAEAALIAREDGALIATLIADLPVVFREVVILREQEELSYAEIAQILGVPAGTVMSRLARGRALLRRGWLRRQGRGGAP